MITKINKLKRFGIYQNFSWGNIDDFKKENLIYGWNYSGKTTLSKLFQILEYKDKNRYFSGSEIEISINDGSLRNINQDTLTSFPFIVKVFNSEYINRIFVWEQPTTGFSSIAFYLGDSAGGLKETIKKYELINNRFKELKEGKYKTIIDSFEVYNKSNGKFSEKAKDIRDNLLPGIFNPITFDKGNLKKIVDIVKLDLDSYVLLPVNRDDTKNEAIAEMKYETLNENIFFSENLISISEFVKSILEDTAPKSISIPSLEQDSALFIWVQSGLSFHEDSSECKFCNQPLQDDKIQILNSFYSIKLKEIQDSIGIATKKIEVEKKIIDFKFPLNKELAVLFQDEYEEALLLFNEAKIKYIIQLDLLKDDLNIKAASIFNSIKATEIEIISLLCEFEKIVTVIKRHNIWINEYASRKEGAIKNILNHYVAEYLKFENYIQKEVERDDANQNILRINTRINSNEILIKGINAQLSDKVKGQEELNEILEILLHRNDIKIAINNDKFRLERTGIPASNLSEGEKTAIAFAYFLTELKALRNDDPPKLNKTIIFLDDPISSLDSNHIFQVRSLLKEFLKPKDFTQLFISTHNFEFFSIMYDSGIFGNLKSDAREDKRPLYFIKRNKDDMSSIEKMPKTFSNYKSEYVGLFHILYEFNNLEDKENFDYLLLLPNALRRFVELYTLSKYPANNDCSVDKRVEIIFKKEDKPYHNIKLLNWFSHQNQIEKFQLHDEKILQISDAISDLIEYLKHEDELHWKGLNSL